MLGDTSSQVRKQEFHMSTMPVGIVTEEDLARNEVRQSLSKATRKNSIPKG